MKIILTAKPNYGSYSIEAGYADNIKHFDHHGEYSEHPSPCNNSNIPNISVLPDAANAYCEITHIDADTFVGLLRLYGCFLPSIDLNLLEGMDTYGTFGYRTDTDTYYYKAGIGQLSRNLLFPRCTDEPQPVTRFVQRMMWTPESEIIAIGKHLTQEQYSIMYRALMRHGERMIVGLWGLSNDVSFDPNLAYHFGYAIVIVWRQAYKNISIYCHPHIRYEFAGKTIAGVQFAGHPKACGSPRGMAIDVNLAREIFEAVRAECEPELQPPFHAFGNLAR